MGDDIIDLQPFIRRKQQLICAHQHTEVGNEGDASLTCSDCGAEIEPWWFIRRLAGWESRLKERHKEYQDACAKQRAEHEEWMARVNADRQRLADEVNHLIATKNALSNEVVNGQRLGLVARRRPRRKK